MKHTVTNKVKYLYLLLTQEGCSKDNPLVLDKPVKVFSLCTSRKYEYKYPFLVEAIYPAVMDDGTKTGSVTLVGRELSEMNYVGSKLVFEKWEGKEALVFDEEPDGNDFVDTWDEFWSWDIDAVFEALRPVLVKPIRGDYYSISTNEDGVRLIHCNGYVWRSDDIWASTEVSWFLMPLVEFIDGYVQRGCEFVDEWYQNVNQYQKDFNDENEALEACLNYFDGKPADAMLGFDAITADTPDGNYINCY